MWEVLRSSVNAWECDHLGHMNVRHYFNRFNDGLAVLLLQLGFAPRSWSERGLVMRARDQHLRFNRELRSGAGIAIRAGGVSGSTTLTAYAEMRTLRDEVAATSVTELSLLDAKSGETVPWPASVSRALSAQSSPVPEYAAVRGVSREPTRVRISRDEALSSGMLPDYLGPVLGEDCDARGIMREGAWMARVSDGVAHFYHDLYGSGERPASVGESALEYRFVFHRWPRVDDAIEVRSGLSALGSKTMQVMHHMFDLESGECLASSQAVVAWFDVVARKALVFPEDVRKQLAAKVITELAL